MKNALPLFLATLVAMAVLGYSMYNKPHKDYAQEEAVQTWNAKELVQEFKFVRNGYRVQYTGNTDT